MRTLILDTRVSHLISPYGGDDPLPSEIRMQVRALLLQRNDCPEEEIEAIDLQILRLVRPYRTDTMIELAVEHFGRRQKINRAEMAEFLARLEAEGFADLSAGGYAPRTRGSLPSSQFDMRGDDELPPDLPSAWTEACRGITLISLVDLERDPGAPASINGGSIRYDEPGNTYPGFRVTIMFAPAALADQPYDQIGQMRRYARRLLVVGP